MYLCIYLSIDRSVYLSVYLTICSSICETSSIFEVDSIKNEAILRDAFKNGKLSAELTALYQCVSRVCHHVYLKYCACHEQVRPGHTKRCACHAKSSWKTSRSDARKCNPSSGNQRPDLLTSLMNVSLVLRLPRDMRLCRPSSNVPRLLTFGKSEQGTESLAPATQNQLLTSTSGARAAFDL